MSHQLKFNSKSKKQTSAASIRGQPLCITPPQRSPGCSERIAHSDKVRLLFNAKRCEYAVLDGHSRSDSPILLGFRGFSPNFVCIPSQSSTDFLSFCDAKMSSELKERLDFALQVSDKAAQTILQYYQGNQLGVESKSDESPVTAADRAR